MQVQRHHPGGFYLRFYQRSGRHFLIFPLGRRIDFTSEILIRFSVPECCVCAACVRKQYCGKFGGKLISFLMKKLPILILSVCVCWLSSTASAQISLTGSNGRAVQFAGIKDAAPKGLVVQMKPNAKVIGIPWAKLDLAALEKDNNKIYVAYLAAKDGETIPLNLGTYEDPKEKQIAMTNEQVRKKNGWYESSISGIKFRLQLPVGTPRGVLLVAHDDRGNSNRMIMGMQQGEGRWGQFQNRHRFALMTYFYETKMKLPTDMDDFIYADKKSGQALLDSLTKIAAEADKPEIADLPIAIYGFGKIGAPFAYNFTQWKPERVVAATVGKGAYYTAKPTEESAKVPMLLLYGKYDNTAAIFGSDRSHEVVFKEFASMNPLWAYAGEFRGKNDDTPECDHVAQDFLHKMIEMRVPKLAPKPRAPKPEEKPAADGDKPDAPKGDDDPEPEPEPEPEVPAMLPFDESESYVGNIETAKYTPIKKDANGVIEEGSTWLPGRDFARLWKQFEEGEIELTIGEGE